MSEFNYLSVQELAELWDISGRRVVQLCKAGQLDKAMKVGKKWMIPADAERPADNRITTGEHVHSTRYYCGNHNIKEWLNGVFDKTGLEEIRKMPPQSVDMILCELPVGDGVDGRETVNLKKLLFEYQRVIKPEGNIVLLSQGTATADVMNICPELLRRKMTWIRACGSDSEYVDAQNGLKSSDNLHRPACVDVCVFSQSEKGTYNPDCVRKLQKARCSVLLEDYGGDGSLTDVIYLRDEKKKSLPNAFQEKIALGRLLASAYSNPGDIVLDSSCGWGFMLAGCLMEGRNVIGFERSVEKKLPPEMFEGHRLRTTQAQSDEAKTAKKPEWAPNPPQYVTYTIQTRYAPSCISLLKDTWGITTRDKRQQLSKCGIVKDCMREERASNQTASQDTK